LLVPAILFARGIHDKVDKHILNRDFAKAEKITQSLWEKPWWHGDHLCPSLCISQPIRWHYNQHQ